MNAISKGVLLGLLGLCFAGTAWATRDPKSEEMAAIQEIAYYLDADCAALQDLVHAQAPRFSGLKSLFPVVESLRARAGDFYDRVRKNSNSPWRTSSSYEELNRAFLEASELFTSSQVFSLDPRLFEEIAYLMGALLSFYSEPIYSYTVIPVYPRSVYAWIPSYYNFSHCRFADPRLFPWGRRVIFAPRRR